MRKVNYIQNKMGQMLLILAVCLVSALQLNAQYCASSGNTPPPTEEGITNFTFAGINNNSLFNSGYSNFTAMVANVTAGQTYPVSVTVSNTSTSQWTETVAVYIDVNNDQIFQVPDERFYFFSQPVPGSSTLAYTGNITIPANAVIGTTRIRVMNRFSSATGIDPCVSYQFGEVEDYSVNIAGSGPPPAPANDLCADGITITCGTPITGTTVNALYDVAGTCVTTNTGPGVWYRILGTGGTFTLDICGSSYDSKLSVFTGSCGSLACVTGNDDFCGTSSQVSFTSVAGTTYHILVHGYLLNTGTFTLTSSCTVPPPCPAPIAAPWTVTAINGATGTAITNCDLSHTVSTTGAGTATADKIHFVHQSLTGDGYVVADISSFTNWTYGGVQFRDGLAPGARKVALQTQLGSRVTRQLRSVAGGNHTVSQLAAPKNNYVRIARVGDVFTSSVSADGVNWTQVNQVTLVLPATLNVGFYANSQLASSGTVNFASAGVYSGSALTSEVDNRKAEISEFTAINAFPNPASSELNINMAHLAGEKVQVTVMNSLGQVALQQNFDSVNEVERLDLNNLSSGVYILQVNAEAVQKFIVKK